MYNSNIIMLISFPNIAYTILEYELGIMKIIKKTGKGIWCESYGKGLQVIIKNVVLKLNYV